MKKRVFDLLEERVVFSFSRTFWTLVVAVSTVAVLVGVYYFLSGFRLPQKMAVVREDDPSVVEVRFDDVQGEIDRSRDEERTGKTFAEIPPSPEMSKRERWLQRYGSWIDSLEALLPPSVYTWEKIVGYYEYPYFRIGYKTKDMGFVWKHLEAIENLHWQPEAVTAALKQLCAVLSRFREKERKEPLEVFVRLYQERDFARKAQIAAIQTRYELELQQAQATYDSTQVARKAQRRDGAMTVAGAFIAVAMTGLLLVLLSIQRYVRRLVEMGVPASATGNAQSQGAHSAT